ncbi:MAG: ferrous iron transporter B, partial [Myxococcales bacterium]|nr:ferrous iron transporter B [Myxococcales bacterium]
MVESTGQPAGRRQRLVALVGNPNTGKTTLFNRLTGANARVGNYPGITVDRTVGPLTLPGGAPVDVLDVPGTYSLVARSPEEQIAIDAVLGRHQNPRPDVVVVVVDATNPERNLYLVLQLLELGLPLVVALNMVDVAEQAGVRVDPRALAAALGVPVVPTIATRRHGLEALVAAIEARLAAPPAKACWVWTPSPALDADLAALVPVLGDAAPGASDPAQKRALALWALMSLDQDDELIDAPGELRLHVLERLQLARAAQRDIDGEVIAARYAWIDQAAQRFMGRVAKARTWTARVDAVLLHPVAGFALFLLLMFTVFQALFAWSDPAIGLIEDGMAVLADGARSVLPEGLLADFVADALIGGVGNVLVFLPQILLLFAFIGVMEDSGYMARAAFLMDPPITTLFPHTTPFLPIQTVYACSVPAI